MAIIKAKKAYEQNEREIRQKEKREKLLREKKIEIYGSCRR